MAKSIQFTRQDTLHAAIGVIPGFFADVLWLCNAWDCVRYWSPAYIAAQDRAKPKAQKSNASDDASYALPVFLWLKTFAHHCVVYAIIPTQLRSFSFFI